MDYLITHFAEIIFYMLAAMAIAGAVGVITVKNPVYAAISLLFTFLVVAALFILRHAEFLAAVQVMVYGGGIMVLFLFVIMLINVKNLQSNKVFLTEQAPIAIMAGILVGALMAAAVLLGVLVTGSNDLAALKMVDGEIVGNTEAIGQSLYTTYLVPFEIVSVVLLVAMIGAIIFGRRDRSLDEADGLTGGMDQ
jgi:NADH-quinone oxidoreductase subunit J